MSFPDGCGIASACVALVVYPVMLAVILATAGLIGDDWLPIDPDIACWILAAFFALGAVVNAISRSPRSASGRWSRPSSWLAASSSRSAEDRFGPGSLRREIDPHEDASRAQGLVECLRIGAACPVSRDAGQPPEPRVLAE